MTADQKVVIWAALISAVPATTLSGVIAWWTYRRDQERIVVRKSPMFWPNYDGSPPTDKNLGGLGVAVTNLSLFPVRIVGLGFRNSDGKQFVFDRDKHTAEEWPEEIPSRARMVVYSTHQEWAQMRAFGFHESYMDWNFVAVANTETSRRFTSNRSSVWIRRPYWAFREWSQSRRARRARVGAKPTA